MVLKSFLPVAEDSDFSIENLPFGVFSNDDDPVPRPGIAIGDYIVDLKALSKSEVFTMYCTCQFDYETLSRTTLNAFAALDRETVGAVRSFVKYILVEHTPILRDNAELRHKCIMEASKATMHLPFAIGDFTDFLNSRTHAKNTHSTSSTPVNMFSPPRAFSGRASSILISGTPIIRPYGQLPTTPPTLAPTRELDVEIELAAFIGVPNTHFSRIPISSAESHIFGLVMLNDWSARDIQRPEDHPFAAFNAKNFASTISPWVVTLDALEPYRVKARPQDPGDVLPQLKEKEDENGKGTTWDISIRMDWTLGDTGETFSPSTSNLTNGYWSFGQMLAHHTTAGCPMRTGDLVGTGTITGEDEGSVCSLVEMTKAGTVEVISPKGARRMFVEDGDEVCYRAWAGRGEGRRRVGFGECKGLILPAFE